MREPLPDGLAGEGELGLLNTPRRAILVSRTPRGPHPATPWVRAVADAARNSAERGETLIVGLGRDPFDVALAVCRRAGGAAIIVLTAPPEKDEFLRERCDLLPARRLLVWPRAERGAPPPREGPQRRRDLCLARLADRAWTVAVRRGGNMAAAAELLAARGCPVEAFGPVEKNKTPRETPAENEPRDPDLLLPAGGGWPWLTHFTREPGGRWPEESAAEYADWLAHGPSGERRTAFAALRRIVFSRRIQACGRLMPLRLPAVSFTARPPWELAPLVRWRRGLGRWTFRPYGLAVRRELLENLGARPVRYLEAAACRRTASAERLYFQPRGGAAGDWTGEAEWRLAGDLDFHAAPAEALLLLVPRFSEARALQAKFGITARVIEDFSRRARPAAGGRR